MITCEYAVLYFSKLLIHIWLGVNYCKKGYVTVIHKNLFLFGTIRLVRRTNEEQYSMRRCEHLGTATKLLHYEGFTSENFEIRSIFELWISNFIKFRLRKHGLRLFRSWKKLLIHYVYIRSISKCWYSKFYNLNCSIKKIGWSDKSDLSNFPSIFIPQGIQTF